MNRRRSLLSISFQSIEHTIDIISDSTYTGRTFYCVCQYDSLTVNGNWSITSGSQYATINSNGKVSIVEGTVNQDITIQVIYRGLSETKTINISYDNQLTIEGSSSISGISGNVIARYNSTIVNPTWSITSGNAYATIDNDGEITIISSGNIIVSAEYNNYITTKNIELIYDAGTTTETDIDENGNVTITTTTTETDSITGAISTTIVSNTLNDDGSTSSSNTEITENQDGSTETRVTTSSSDGSSSVLESTSYQDGSSQSTIILNNSDGSSSSNITNISAPDQNGSVTSTNTTTNYNSNGVITGSTENERIDNSDGSYSSSTTNYDSSGNPTDKTNEDIDVSGNINTQDIEYDEYGTEIVTGYTIDTSNNQNGSKSYNLDGVDTEYYAFDVTHGFVLNFHFTIDFNNQPANQNENHHNILTMKRANPSPWYGFQFRHSQTNGYIQLGTQFSSGNNTNTTINPSNLTNNVGEYNLRITYDPTLSKNSFICYNLITNKNVYTSNGKFPDDNTLKYLTVCIGYAQDENGNPYRYSNINVIDFNITRT